MVKLALMERVNRRGFLITPFAIAAPACANQYRSPTAERARAAQEAKPTAEIILQGKERLTKEINDLPPSIVKDLLVQRLLPYYQTPMPATFNRSGFELKVHSAALTIQTDDHPHGAFSVSLAGEKFLVNKSGTLYLPLLGIVKPEDLNKFPKAADGTLLYPVTYQQDDLMYEGFSTGITVWTKQPRDTYTANYESLTYLKEACSLLLFDILLEEYYKKMTSLNLPTSLEVRGDDNKLTTVEVINRLQGVAFSKKGRSLAALDLAGAILHIKAVEDTPLIQTAAIDSRVGFAVPAMRAVNLGNSSTSVLLNSLREAVNIGLAYPNLPFTGDMTQLP